ncbi:hypothetical protein TSAR_016654 [Trichomalopsis sarcophagae]|uniref:Uncharacterized protein n=1 Tax=Trichomalopsis sarcophagae TaxID=543379 RepID=A0A232EZJ0_9HYME|nr:hypothetical protein TSAR_016654 [Trichomalopsis sarcophagae]
MTTTPRTKGTKNGKTAVASGCRLRIPSLQNAFHAVQRLHRNSKNPQKHVVYKTQTHIHTQAGPARRGRRRRGAVRGTTAIAAQEKDRHRSRWRDALSPARLPLP